jgi:hypothetical protein
LTKCDYRNKNVDDALGFAIFGNNSDHEFMQMLVDHGAVINEEDFMSEYDEIYELFTQGDYSYKKFIILLRVGFKFKEIHQL